VTGIVTFLDDGAAQRGIRLQLFSYFMIELFWRTLNSEAAAVEASRRVFVNDRTGKGPLGRASVCVATRLLCKTNAHHIRNRRRTCPGAVDEAIGFQWAVGRKSVQVNWLPVIVAIIAFAAVIAVAAMNSRK
jgi:hypothetical protein